VSAPTKDIERKNTLTQPYVKCFKHIKTHPKARLGLDD
jgi:hypothetical protein